MNEKLRGVIFDMDGLMFDTELLYYEATQETADQLGIPYDAAIYDRYLGVSDEELWDAYHSHYDLEFGFLKVELFIKTAYERTMALFDSGKVTVKPGLFELLTYLNANQIEKVVASSNKRTVIENLLTKNGLRHEFTTIVSAEDVRRAKPDPEIFVKAQEKLKLPKDQLLILEDSPNGIKAANDAGISVVMIPDLIQPTAETKENSLVVLKNLGELPKFLEDKAVFLRTI